MVASPFVCHVEQAMRVLLVEDDIKLARALQRGLTHDCHVVEAVGTCEEGLRLATEQDYDVVVLDLLLPGIDGLSVCEELRRRQRWAPVLMLTALSDVRDRIRGLDGGADDYLVKPFDLGELLARLRVLGRRGPVERARVLTVGDLHVDAGTRVVTRGGHQVELTAREFDVLEVLVRSPGRLVSRSALLDAVWQADNPGSANIVDVYIGYLRRKLERQRDAPLIRTVRGRGFVLEPP